MTATEISIHWRRGAFSLEFEASWEARVAVLFGPSGCGKTTVLETVLGLHPTAGARVRFAGEELEDPARRLRTSVEARRLGWVPQDPSLFPHLSVAGNLELGMRRGGAEADRARDRAIEVLEIGALLERSPSQLSGGERQRAALARALASAPRALLLDEPLSSLDVPLRARVLPYLLRIRDELDLPMLYITHDADEAMLLGETVVVLEAGRAVAAGPPREVLWSRAVLPLSEALGLENVLEGVALAGRAGEAEVEIGEGVTLVVPGRLEAGERVRLGLRGEDVLLAVDPPGRISARNVLPASVTRCERRDGDVWVHLDVGARLCAKITPGAADALGLGEGARVYAVIKAQALRRLA